MRCLPASWRLFIGDTEDALGPLERSGSVGIIVETQTESQFHIKILNAQFHWRVCLPFPRPPHAQRIQVRVTQSMERGKDWESERNRTVETHRGGTDITQKFANEDSTFLSKAVHI